MNNVRIAVCFSLAALFAQQSSAQTSYPMLMSLHPTAAQIGQTTEHTIESRASMYGAYQVLVAGEGVTGEIVHPEMKEEDKEKKPNLQQMKVRFTVDANAEPGVRDFRIATPTGVSTLGQLVIARDTIVVETADNDKPEQAQPITLPATVCGSIEKAEDVDYFKFSVEAGQAFSFHVRSMRLQNRIHDLQTHSDPILTIRTAAGSTVASSDNYFYGDPCVGHRFEHAGEYLLEIRDVRYQGNKYWEYSIEISDRPFVTNVFPMAVEAGQETSFELIGFQIPDPPSANLTVPGDRFGESWLSLPLGDSRTNPVPLVVSQTAVTLETEQPNNEPTAAQSVVLPGGITGRIEADGDIDCFSFEAKKGQKLSFQVTARRQQSSLDSHLRILDSAGKQLQLNDDMRLGKRSYADSWIENWTVPADGMYVLEIRDLHLRGGPSFVYYIEAVPAEPYFELNIDTDKTPLTPGTSGVVYIRAVRKNGFEGEIQLHVDGLPMGVTADCGRILAGKAVDGCIVLHAAADAALLAGNATFRGTSTWQPEGQEPKELSAVAIPYQETYQPGGGRGHWPAEMHTVAVGEPSDIRAVVLSETDVTLKPGESKKIDVKIERAEGFDKNVTLDVIYKHLSSVYGSSLPEGVTLEAKSSKTLLTGKISEGHITLKAADNAPAVEKQLVPVMANVSLNFVMKATYSGKPLSVTVAAPEEDPTTAAE